MDDEVRTWTLHRLISTAAAVAPNSASVGKQGAEVSFAELIEAARGIWSQTFEGDIDESSAVLLAVAATVFTEGGDNGVEELASRLSKIVAAIGGAPYGTELGLPGAAEATGEERKAIVLRLFEERLCNAAARRQQANGAPAAELPRYTRAAASM